MFIIYIVLISYLDTKKIVDFPSIYENSQKSIKKKGKNEQKTTSCENIVINES